MATRSRIGIVNLDGTVLSIYCHWDGYTSNNGRILNQHYQDEAKIRELMKLGNLSCLGAEIGVKHAFDAPGFGTKAYEEYEQKFGNMCLAYGRDRGEPNTDARVDADIKSFDLEGEEYNYLWINGQWTVQNYDRPRRPVVEALTEKETD